jgi:hypothetical protein
MEDFLFGMFFGLAFGIAATATINTVDWRSDLVTRGLAIYCPLDGNFAFIGECDK